LIGRDDKAVLMRVQREDTAFLKRLWAGFHLADGGIAVFHRKWKIAALRGRPHSLPLAPWHPPVKDEALSASAQPRVKSAHQHLAGAGMAFAAWAQLGLPRRHIPEGAGFNGGPAVGCFHGAFSWHVRVARAKRDRNPATGSGYFGMRWRAMGGS